ncbi:MAG: GTPase RsgA, partial [Cyanobium sp.]
MAEVWGRVVALQANYCSVVPDHPAADSALGELQAPPDPPPQSPALPQRLLCTRRTRLDHAGLQVCVGDRVRLEGIDVAAGRAAVAALAPRANLLQRPPVANVSRVVVVASLADPPLDPDQLSRFLISAEACGGAVEVVLSKADLV